MSAMRWLTLLWTLLLCAPATAHKASDAYLQLGRDAQGLSLRVDVALRDLDLVIDLDADGNAQLSWGEVKAAWPAIASYVGERLKVDGCALKAGAPALERRNDGSYAVLQFASACQPAQPPAIDYRLLREADPTHRGILRIDWPGAEPVVRLLDPGRPQAVAAPPEPGSFLASGVHHIVTGYDHLLFLLCLLLPSVLQRTPQGWAPVERLRDAVLPVGAIVSAFTVAHSITLALASLKLVLLPAWFIEPAIAATIVLAALDNLRPIFGARRGIVTFLFGLIHGFGFANVLGELDLPPLAFATALLQFNLGLELGQLAIVGAVAAALFLLRDRPGYPRWAVGAGSTAAIALATVWFVERSTQLSILG